MHPAAEAAQAGALARRRRGSWLMIVCGWTGVFALAVAFFGGALDKQRNPNSATALSGQRGELTLLPNANGHYLAEGTMNGKRALFLLDTGATEIAVPEAVARRLGLAEGEAATVSTANGVVRARKTRIAEIHIGPIALADLRGTILPNMRGEAVLLGMNALGRLDISQRGGKLMLAVPGVLTAGNRRN